MAIQDYLQGSQLGGILQGLEQPQQSYVAPLPGGSPQEYTPGYGQAPYAQQPLQSSIPSIQDPAQAQQMKHLQYLIDSGQDWGGQAAATLSGMSMASPQGAAAPATTSNDGTFTNIGQPSAEDIARNAAIMDPSYTNLFSGQTGGSGGGGGGGSAGGTGTSPLGTGTGTGTGAGGSGLNLGQPGGAVGGAPAFSSTGQTPNNAPIGYQAPPSPGQPQGGGVLQMQQADPQAALQQYMNTPGYQLLGNNQAQQFQASPGYQYAVDQALQQVGQQSSARGLLGSGAMLRGMTDRAQGMASQEYGNWWNRQNQLYGDYQNRLQGLAGGPTGADQAMQLGQNLGAGSMQMGSNLGSLFGSQGTAGMGGIINTGAAQANAMTQAGNQQAQILGANQATQLAGAVASQKGLF